MFRVNSKTGALDIVHQDQTSTGFEKKIKLFFMTPSNFKFLYIDHPLVPSRGGWLGGGVGRGRHLLCECKKALTSYFSENILVFLTVTHFF